MPAIDDNPKHFLPFAKISDYSFSHQAEHFKTKGVGLGETETMAGICQPIQSPVSTRTIMSYFFSFCHIDYKQQNNYYIVVGVGQMRPTKAHTHFQHSIWLGTI